MPPTLKAREAFVHHRAAGVAVEVRADIVTTKTVYPFRCVCSPDDDHDHEKAMVDFAALVDRHDAVIDDYRAHEGTKGSVNGIAYEITDCKIRILGPAMFELYLSWLEDQGAADRIRQIRTWTSDAPDNHLAAATIVKLIETDLVGRSQSIAAAHAVVDAHLAPVAMKP